MCDPIHLALLMQDDRRAPLGVHDHPPGLEVRDDQAEIRPLPARPTAVPPPPPLEEEQSLGCKATAAASGPR